MTEDNRWAGFSDEELQLIADRLGNALLSAELGQERKDRARIVEEINAEFRRREGEQSTYRGPGRYRDADGHDYEVIGWGVDGATSRRMILYRMSTTEAKNRSDGHWGIPVDSFERRDGTERAFEYLGPLEESTTAAAEAQRLKRALRRVHNHDQATSEIRGLVESVILFGHDVPEQATAPATVKVTDAGEGWANIKTEDGVFHYLRVGDTITVPAPVVEKPAVHYYERADGRLICHSSAKPCGRVYRDHPTETYGDLVLHRLCDGRLVKL